MRFGLMAVAACLLAGCSHVPKLEDGPKAGSIPPENWRKQLVGEWQIHFYYDSARPGGRPGSLAPASGKVVTGVLRFLDSLSSNGNDVWSELRVDFAPVLGRPISCAPPPRAFIGVSGQADALSLWFTPGAGDCGFGATASGNSDSLVGRWSESSFVGAAVVGRFRMIRAR